MKGHRSHYLMMHNHPDNVPPSINDVNVLTRNRKGVDIAIALCHDGGIVKYTGSTGKMPSQNQLNKQAKILIDAGFTPRDSYCLAVKKLFREAGSVVQGDGF